MEGGREGKPLRVLVHAHSQAHTCLALCRQHGHSHAGQLAAHGEALALAPLARLRHSVNMEDEEDVSADPYLPYDGGGDTIPLQTIPKRGTPRSRLSRLRLFFPP